MTYYYAPKDISNCYIYIDKNNKLNYKSFSFWDVSPEMQCFINEYVRDFLYNGGEIYDIMYMLENSIHEYIVQLPLE